jgi:hypothetical protein
MSPSAEVTPLIPPMRWLLYVAAFLVFLAGLVLFVFPLRTDEFFAWTVNPPMTAVFLGAAYWSAAGLEVAGARSASWDSAKLAVWPVFIFTALTLGVTLLHIDRFHLSPNTAPTAQIATWAWLAIYATVPVAMLVISRMQVRSPRLCARIRERGIGRCCPLRSGCYWLESPVYCCYTAWRSWHYPLSLGRGGRGHCPSSQRGPSERGWSVWGGRPHKVSGAVTSAPSAPWP